MATAEPSPPRRLPADTFAARLLLIRHELRMSTEQIARLCDVKPSTWNQWEQGRMPRNMAQVVSAIADKTGYDARWLMWGFSYADNRKRLTAIKGEGKQKLRHKGVSNGASPLLTGVT